MSYTKHNYQKGDELLASQLNDMDDQIALNEQTADTLVTVSNTEPTAEKNRVWVKATPSEIQIPTMDDFDEVSRQLSDVEENQIPELKSTINEDTTKFNPSDFENGTINGTGGNESLTYRVRTKGYFHFDTDVWIFNDAPNYIFSVFFYSESGDVSASSHVFYNTRNLLIPAGTWFRILIMRNINEDTTETANIPEFVSGFSFTTVNYLLQTEIEQNADALAGIDAKTLTLSETGRPGMYINTSGARTYNRNTSLFISGYNRIPESAYEVEVSAGGFTNVSNVVSYYNENLEYISGYTGATGVTSYSSIPVPFNAKYYVISSLSVSALSATFKVFKRLDDIETSLGSIPEIDMKYRYADIFTDKTVYPRTNINPSTGAADSNNSFAATGFIAVEPETTYYVFRDDKKYHQVGNMAFYNANKARIDGQQSSYSVFSTPENCYYVRFCVLYAGEYTESNFTFANMHITKALLGPIEQIPYVSTFRTFGNLYGKKWVGLGDSITEVNDRAELHYQDYICAEQGMTFANFAVGGSGYMNRQNQNKAFYQLAEGIDTDGDIITIMGGVNDCLFAGEIGTATDTGTTTVCGCVNATIDAIEAKYPLHAPLGIISPLPCDWVDSNNESNYDTQLPSDPTCRMAILTERLAEICKLRGYPFLDLFHSSGLKPNIADVKAEYYSCGSTLTGDGLHPNSKGQKLFYPRIMEFIKGICR